MKKILIPTVASLAVMLLLSGCVVAFNFGGSKKDSTNSATTNSNLTTTSNSPHPVVGQQVMEPTIGQQLIDLKKAKDVGTITDTEYEREKTKLLNQK